MCKYIIHEFFLLELVDIVIRNYYCSTEWTEISIQKHNILNLIDRFQSVIVLLYVLDNETNTIIKISCFVGLLIEIWKINKVVDFSINAEKPTILGIFPRIQFKDKGNYAESGTREFDRKVCDFESISYILFVF